MLLMAEKSESYKRKMSNELAEVEDNPVDTKLKMFKKPVNQTSKKNVLYKCSFCKFQSQDLEPVRCVYLYTYEDSTSIQIIAE